jgi:uncharacterized repeat protein (TIGR01451 family)
MPQTGARATGRARRRLTTVVLGTVAAFAAASLGALPASAEGPSQLSLDKSVSTATVAPGETFSYDMQVGCSAIDLGVGCTNAMLVDPVPAEFDIVGVSVGTGLAANTPAIDGNTVTVTFTSPLSNPAGSIGLLASATGVVTITVRARTDLPFEADGVPVDNTATLSATNAPAPAVSTATVTPAVPLALGTTASKSFTPRIAAAIPGTATELSVGAVNTSNAGVTSLTIVDPSDPAATPNPFDLLAVTALGAVTFPAGADQVEVDAWNGSWVTQPAAATAVLPAGLDPATITGLRFIFSNSGGGTLPPGASASVDVELVQRPGVSTLTTQMPVGNSAESTVSLGAQTATDTANGIYLILPNVVNVGATKSFTPDAIVAGDSSLVTVGGSNQSVTTLDRLDLVEPTQTSADPFADGFPPGVTFTGFTNDVQWPAGATAAEAHFYYSDGSQETLPAAARDTLPDPDETKTVVRFVASFTGSIAPGQSASVPFTIDTDPDLTDSSVVITNSASAMGTAPSGAVGSADATADLTVYTTRLDVTVDKSISPNQLLANPGEFVTVQLPAQLSPFPASTTDAHVLVVQDPPGTPPDESDWWNHFNATAITQTAVPAGATMTVRYWNGDAWIVLPGASGIAGPTLFSAAIDTALQETIQGLQFIFVSADGFPPGTTVKPNVTMALRSQLRDGTGPASGEAATVENCAAAAASSGTTSTESTTPSPCPAVTLVPGNFPGADDFLGKTWVGPKVITARTEDRVSSQLSWSTGGRSNISPMVISDPADPTTTAVPDSVFNAFDLIGVPAIDAGQDPHLKYDQIRAVQVYDGTAWVDTTNDPCPSACDGTFPGVALTAAERASTIGVRLVFIESPTRAASSVGDPTAPPVGSGVTRSIGNDRGIVLTFQLRDDVRDPVTMPDPVVGTRLYNTGEAGAVLNTARATGTSTIDGSTVTDTADDTIRILDVPLNVTVSKQWTGGPLGIPQPGTDPSIYPSGRVGITATNATAANVDQLVVSDPAVPGAAQPFEDFTLTRLVTVSVPAGATSTRVELTDSSGVVTSYTRDEALQLTRAELADVVGIAVTHDGRIDAGATAAVTFDTQLRPAHRSNGTPVTAADSPVLNVAQAGVGDEGGAPGGNPRALTTAGIVLTGGTISVTAGKTFTPSIQTEPDDAPIMLTLTGRPGGTVRTTTLTVTDDAGTFWNAFDYVGLAAPLALAAPITRVRIDACVGRSLADPTLDCVASGGHWVLGVPATASQANAQPLPATVTAVQVEGLRFVYSRADGAPFENPANPLQSASLSVQRRVDLRSGGPVPSDLAGNAPAPGESAPGLFSNRVTADVVGAINDGGTPFVASSSANATVRYLHAATSVVVQKTPAGVQQPGAVIPYTLTVTNNGAIAITDPVIVDQLPTDASGPMLVFDPFADPSGPGPYSYSLTGSAPDPASGTPLPTTPALVSPAVSQGGARITFSFAPGSVLEVGQRYAITIQLMFRTGLTASTVVTNSFGVTGERPFDSCSGAIDPGTGACTTNTTVTVQVAGALRGIKSVRAVDPSLGVDDVAPSIPCAADADGFYAAQCVPIVRPGDNEVWRLGLINTGTLPMNRMVAIDRLPEPGDTGALATLPRGSEFRPTFTGTTALARGPGDALMTVFYTTSATPCVADLNTTGTPCAAGSWTAFTGAVDPTIVRALKFVVDFPTPIQPAGAIAIDVTTRSPGSAPAGGVAPIAWNTVAVGGRVLNNAVVSSTPSTEGNKVGVQLATGSLSVVKEVTGPGAAFAPTTFTGTLQCISAGEVVPPRSITLAPGIPLTIGDLPLGADCTVVEDSAGQTSSAATHATVGLTTEPIAVVTVTNRYELAGLVVTKTVDSAAVDQDGVPVAYGPFTVSATCSFLGAPVYASGFGPTVPMTAELLDGESLTLAGLPAGAACHVAETDARGATDTTVEATTGGVSTGVQPGTTADLVLAPNDIARVTNTLAITNTFDVGSLVLTKTVTGPGATAFGAGPFVLGVDCELTDASGTRTVWSGDVSLGGTDALTRTIDDLATGAVCTVVETQAGGATTSTVTPGQATIGDGTSVSVSAENGFGIGSLHVDKERDGLGAGLYGAGPFELTLICTAQVDGVATLVAIPGGSTRALTAADGYAADYLVLPAGASCLLRETADGGATDSGILADDGSISPVFTVVDGATTHLRAVNTFDLGSITVTKTIEGDDATRHESENFVVHLACTSMIDGASRDVAIPGGADRTLSAATGLVTHYEQLPVGAECTVTETSDGGASAVTISPDDGAVTVADSADIAISVVNRFDDPATLPFTGTDARGELAAAALLVIAGILLLRRRRPGLE